MSLPCMWNAFCTYVLILLTGTEWKGLLLVFQVTADVIFLPCFQIMILNIQHNFKVSVYETRSDKECPDLGVYCQCINNKHCFLKFLSEPWKGCAEAAWADFWILCKKVVSNSSQYFCFLLFIYLFFIYLCLYSLYIYIL